MCKRSVVKYLLYDIIELLNHKFNLQVLAIEKWDTDTVEEFLKTHLEPVEDDGDDFLNTNNVF